MQLAAACLGMGDKSQEYRPPITFVVVQKRHHTRLFPGRPNEGDRSGNILPGKCTAFHIFDCKVSFGRSSKGDCLATTCLIIALATYVSKGDCFGNNLPDKCTGYLC